jgi:uncharacterized protein YndB with AHSA1/START domain
MDDAVAARTGTTLRLWHKFEATPERVFAAWTRPDALRLWWCPVGWIPVEIEVDLRPDGPYRMAMSRRNDARLVTVHGRFLAIEPARRLVYTWSWDGAFPAIPESRVTVEFNAVGDGTELVLRQEALAMRFCAQHLSGWLAALVRVAIVVHAPISTTQTAGMVPVECNAA